MTSSMRLYPRLSGAQARSLVEGLRTESIATVHDIGAALLNDLTEDGMIIGSGIEYGATGGARIKAAELNALKAALIEHAEACGYNTTGESTPLSKEGARAIDVRWTRCLHAQMQISRDEAAQSGVWAFLGCVLVPGLVRWRFFSTAPTGTTAKRFTGSLQRNTFYRLWWRAALLNDPQHDDPYWLLDALMEDEQVSLAERPTLSGCGAIVLPAARLFVRRIRPRTDIGSQMEVMRQLSKRMLRMLGITAYELMTPAECDTAAQELLDATLLGMQLPLCDDALADLRRPAWMSKLFETLGLTTLKQVAELKVEDASKIKGVGKAKLRQLGPVIEQAKALLAAQPEPETLPDPAPPPEPAEPPLSRFSEAEAEILRQWAHLELNDTDALYAHLSGPQRRAVRAIFFPYERFYESLAAWRSGER